MPHLMIDIETLGRRPDCIITQIGGVFFEPEGTPGEYGYHFRSNVSLASQKGRTCTTDTIQFWLTQSHEASAHIVDKEDENPDLLLVMREFRSFITMNTVDKDKLMVWANGAAFDFPKLEDAFEFCDMKAPWEYHQVNDLRTIRNLVYPKRCHEEYDSAYARGQAELKHDALADCVQQVAMLQELLVLLQNNKLPKG